MHRQKRDDKRWQSLEADIGADKENCVERYHLQDGDLEKPSMALLRCSQSLIDDSLTPRAPKKKKFFKNTAKRIKIFGSLKKKNSDDGLHRVVVSESLSGETAEFVTVDSMLEDDKMNEVPKRDRKRKKSQCLESTADLTDGPFRSPLLSVESSLRKKVQERRMLVAAYQTELEYQGNPAHGGRQHPSLSQNSSMELANCTNRCHSTVPTMREMVTTKPWERKGDSGDPSMKVGQTVTKPTETIKNGTNPMTKYPIKKIHITANSKLKKQIGFLPQTDDGEKHNANRNNEAVTVVSELSMGSPMTAFRKKRLQYLLTESNVPSAKEENISKKPKVESPLVEQTKSEFGFCGCPNYFYADGKVKKVVSCGGDSSSSSRRKERNKINQFLSRTASRSDSSVSEGSSDFSIECKHLPKTTSSLTSNSSDDSQDPSEDDESCSVSTAPPSFHSILYDVASKISSRKSQMQKSVPSSVGDASAATKRVIHTFRGRLAECIAPTTDSPPSVKLNSDQRR